MVSLPSNDRRFRALIADDDAVTRQMISFALARESFDCDLAVDGVEAASLLSATRYDLLVTDLRMPNKNGHALAIDVLGREMPPVVMVHTCVDDPRLAKDLALRGVDDIVYKPANYATFAAKARGLVERRRDQRVQIPAKPIVDENSGTANTQVDDGSPPFPADPDDPPADSNAQEASCSDWPQRDDAAEACGVAAVRNSPYRIAVLLNEPLRSEELARQLCSDSVEATTAANADSLYRLLKSAAVDLILIEEELEGFLSGSELLERLAKDLLAPQAILMCSRTGRADVDNRRCDDATILRSNSSFQHIREVVHQLLSSVAADESRIPLRARKLIEQCGEIPPLPQLITKILPYIDMEPADIPLDDLAQHISIDPKATAELLKLTNSSFNGLRRRVLNVLDAVTFLGSRRTISFVTASAMLGIESKLLQGWSLPLRTWYHQRCVLIADTSAAFAKGFERVCPEMAFLLGLLQDVGILALAHNFGEPYLKYTIRRSREVARAELQSLEQEDFGVTHAEVSAALLDSWQFPRPLIEPVLQHHGARRMRQTDSEQAFLRVMRIGEAFANLSDLPHAFRIQVLNGLLADYGPDQLEECRFRISEAATKTAESCKLLSLPAPDPAMLQKLIPAIIMSKTGIKVSEPLPVSATSVNSPGVDDRMLDDVIPNG